MKNLSILIALILVSGCASQKRCWNKFPPQVITETIIEEVTVFKDTTIYVRLDTERSEVSDSVTSPCPEHDTPTKVVKRLIYSLDTLSAESNLSTASTWTYDSRRYLLVEDKDTTLIIKLENAIRERDRLEKIVKTEIHIPPAEKYTPWYVILLLLSIGIPVGYGLRIVHKMIQ